MDQTWWRGEHNVDGDTWWGGDGKSAAGGKQGSGKQGCGKKGKGKGGKGGKGDASAGGAAAAGAGAGGKKLHQLEDWELGKVQWEIPTSADDAVGEDFFE